LRILEIGAIKALTKAGFLVICCGGGGIPVTIKDGIIHGVDAVIDKDRTSSLLSSELKADAFIMLTDVNGLYKDWGMPTCVKVENINIDNPTDLEICNALEQGTMGPKVEAAVSFVQANPHGWAAIGRLEDLPQILQGQAGTNFHKGANRPRLVYH